MEINAAQVGSRTRIRWTPAFIVGVYLAGSLVWIWLSDRVVEAISQTERQGAMLQSLKGSSFIVFTGVVLYFMTRAGQRQKREMNEELLREEDRLRQILDTAPVLIWMSGTDKKCTFFNKGWLDFRGRTAAEEMGDGWADGVHPEDLAGCISIFHGAYQAIAPFSMAYRLRRADGVYRWVRDEGVPRVDPAGELLGFIGSCFDITEGHDAQDSLAKHQFLLEKAQEVARLGSWVASPDREGTLEWSPGTYNVFAISPRDFHNTVAQFMSMVHPDDREAVVQASNDAIANGRPYEIEHRIVRGDGAVAWVHEKADIERDATGKPVRMIGVVQDVTDRRLAEEAVRMGEERYRVLFEQNPMPMWAYEPESLRFLTVNDAAVRHYGYSREEFLRMRIMDIQPAADVIESSPAAGGGWPGLAKLSNWSHRRKDGSIIRVDVTSSPVRLNDRDAVLVLAHDVTDQLRAQAAIVRSEERYRALFESNKDGILLCDERGAIADANPAACKILGLRRRDLLAQNVASMRCGDGGGRLDTAFRTCLQSGAAAGETEFALSDGSRRAVEYSCTLVFDRLCMMLLRDATERRDAERRRQVMVSELDHRVKNNLAAVITLAEQTARASETMPDFTAKFMGRLRTLARMHGALSQMRWEGVGLRELTRQTIETYHSDRGCRVELSGPDVILPPTAATPVAMTIHELATNAAKYGVLSTDGGMLAVHWDIQTRESARWLSLKWTEKGGPPVKPPSRRGFGIELIEGGIAHELKGTARLSFDPEGVICDLQIPLGTR